MLEGLGEHYLVTDHAHHRRGGEPRELPGDLSRYFPHLPVCVLQRFGAVAAAAHGAAGH